MKIGEDVIQPVSNGKSKGILTSIFSKGTPEKKQATGGEHAMTYTLNYLPENSRGQEIDFLNALDVDLQVAPMKLCYSHKLLMSLLNLYEAYQIDHNRKLNQKKEVEKKIKRRRTLQAEEEAKIQLDLSKNKDVQGNAPTIEWAAKIMQAKAKFNMMVKKLDKLLQPLNYNVLASFGGARINLLEQGRPNPIIDFGFPSGKLEAVKQEKQSKIAFMGFELQQYDSIETSVEYIKEVFTTLMDKFEYLKEFYKSMKTI